MKWPNFGVKRSSVSVLTPSSLRTGADGIAQSNAPMQAQAVLESRRGSKSEHMPETAQMTLLGLGRSQSTGNSDSNATKGAGSERQSDVLSILPSYRSEIITLVAQREDQCIALDLGYNTVGLISMVGFSQSLPYQSIVQSLKPRALSLALERAVSPQEFVAIRQHLREQARLTLSMELAQDQRNIHLYNDLIQGAYLLGATDVHFFYKDDAEPALVRLRLFGRMMDWKSFDGKFIRQALAAAYSASAVPGTNSENDWSPAKPCSVITAHELRDTSGRIRNVSGRFTSRPAVGGACKASVRLLDTDVRDVRIPTLQELGYAPSHIQAQLLPALRKNEGMILIAGGTGSGKSTTLRTFMDILPQKESLERYSVEDPVEYVLPGVVQLSIQRASDASDSNSRLLFVSALRDLMRMDPDVVMIGEIRDALTAQLASELVNTGHRVLGTVHGNGGIDVFDRLTGKELQVSCVTLSSGSFLLVSMYQKLLPILCSHCKKPAKDHLTIEQKRGLQRFGIDPGRMYVANPEGCPECRLPGIPPTGTKGLTVAAEVVSPDAQLLAHIRVQDWQAAKAHWRNSRCSDYTDPDMTGKTAFEHAIYKMSCGLLDINDIERDFEPLLGYEIHVPERLARSSKLINAMECAS